MISSEYIAENITHFNVGSYVPWLSDHCMIKTKFNNKYSLPTEGEGVEEVERVHPGFIWDEKSVENFRSSLTSLSTEIKIRTLLSNSEPDPSALAESIKDILWTNALSSKVNAIKTGGERDISEPWFDKECADFKNEISKLGKTLANNPSDFSIRNTISEKKKIFRKVSLAKKRRYKKNVVESLKSKRYNGRPKDFWQALRKISAKNKHGPVHPSMS